MLQTKKLRSKSWKTRVFFTFRLPILDGRVHEQVSSVLFFTVFFEGERHDLSKTGGFGRKMGPPPPGKPVTFYECHPEDHAPAPSVRADLHVACQSSLQHGLLWAGPSEKHVVPSAGHIIYHRSPSQARLKPCFKLSWHLWRFLARKKKLINGLPDVGHRQNPTFLGLTEGAGVQESRPPQLRRCFNPTSLLGT